MKIFSSFVHILFITAMQITVLSAQQFIFFDDVLVQDSTGIPALNRLGPYDLSAPVDYTRGNLYVRLEIIEKPSDLTLRPAFFIWQDEDIYPEMGHMGVNRADIPDITKEGVYYLNFKNPNEWWHGDYPVPDWGRPFDKMALVPWTGDKDEQYYTVDCRANCFKSGDIADHTPIVYRATGIWVAPEHTLVPPKDWDCPADWQINTTQTFDITKADNPDQSTKELLLIDEIIVHEQDTSMVKKMGFSEFMLPEKAPSDWTSPIAYKDGTVYFRATILTKPSNTPIHYQLGFQWEGGCNGHYFKEKFPNNRLVTIKKPGTYTWQQDIPSWWEQDCQEQDPIDWTKRISRLLAVVWDETPRVMDDRWGFQREDMNFDLYYPMVTHLQAVLVAPGETFSGWGNYSITAAPNRLRFHRKRVFDENEEAYMGFGIGDISGDGLPDLAIQEGGYGGELVWYEQITEERWKKHVIAEKNASGVHFSSADTEVGDIDGDGDIDVLGFEHIGEWQNDYRGDRQPSILHWFENLGEGKSWQQHTIGKVPDFVKDAELRDFNQDGKLDLVTITYRDKNTLSIFRQHKKGLWFKVQDFPIRGLHEGMDCGDIDGDGDVDIAANGYWIENPGGNLRKPWTVRTVNDRWFTQNEKHWRKNATKVTCQDINADGRSEIFIAHSEKAGYPIAWYENANPLDSTWTEHIIAEGFKGVHTLQTGDLDNDGDFDVLIGENGDHFIEADDQKREARIFINNGDNKTWTTLRLKDDGLYNGLLYDINQDGLLDICGPSGHQGDPYLIFFNKK